MSIWKINLEIILLSFRVVKKFTLIGVFLVPDAIQVQQSLAENVKASRAQDKVKQNRI